MIVTAVFRPSTGTTTNPSCPSPTRVSGGMPTGRSPVRMVATALAPAAAPSQVTTR